MPRLCVTLVRVVYVRACDTVGCCVNASNCYTVSQRRGAAAVCACRRLRKGLTDFAEAVASLVAARARKAACYVPPDPAAAAAATAGGGGGGAPATGADGAAAPPPPLRIVAVAHAELSAAEAALRVAEGMLGSVHDASNLVPFVRAVGKAAGAVDVARVSTESARAAVAVAAESARAAAESARASAARAAQSALLQRRRCSGRDVTDACARVGVGVPQERTMRWCSH